MRGPALHPADAIEARPESLGEAPRRWTHLFQGLVALGAESPSAGCPRRLLVGPLRSCGEGELEAQHPGEVGGELVGVDALEGSFISSSHHDLRLMRLPWHRAGEPSRTFLSGGRHTFLSGGTTAADGTRPL